MRRRLLGVVAAASVAVASGCRGSEPAPPNASRFEVWDEAIGWVDLPPAPVDEPAQAWARPLSADDTVVVAGSSVVIATAAGAATTVEALDVTSGEPSWSVEVATGATQVGLDVDARHELIGVRHDAAADRSTLTLLDADDGATVWTGDADAVATWVAIDDLAVVTDFVDPTYVSTAIDRATGDVAWTIERSLVERDGHLLIDDILSETYGVVDPPTGQVRWERPRQRFSDAQVIGSTLVMSVDVSGEANLLLGDDLGTGEPIWRLEVPELGRARTVALGDATALVGPGTDATDAVLVAVDLSTGASLWQRSFDVEAGPPRAFLVDGEPRVLVASSDTELEWLDGGDGEVLETADRPDALGAFGPYGNGIAYLDARNEIEGVTLPDLDERWDVPLATDAAVSIDPIDGGFLVQTADELAAYRG